MHLKRSGRGTQPMFCLVGAGVGYAQVTMILGHAWSFNHSGIRDRVEMLLKQNDLVLAEVSLLAHTPLTTVLKPRSNYGPGFQKQKLVQDLAVSSTLYPFML